MRTIHTTERNTNMFNYTKDNFTPEEIDAREKTNRTLRNLYYAAQRTNYPDNPTLPEWIMDGTETAEAYNLIKDYVRKIELELVLARRELNRKKTLKEKLKDLRK